MIQIRLGSVADAGAIARVRRESWLAAYEGIIAAPVIDRATAVGSRVVAAPPYRRTLVALGGDHPAVVGYAAYGPERTVAAAIPPHPAPEAAQPGPGPLTPAGRAAADPLTPAGRAGEVGELYALYVTPAWWSTGTGRALMDSVLSALEAERYRHVVLWVLADNARARRFYERAGFAPDGGTNILTGLGGVLEIRYSRALCGDHPLALLHSQLAPGQSARLPVPKVTAACGERDAAARIRSEPTACPPGRSPRRRGCGAGRGVLRGAAGRGGRARAPRRGPP